MDKLNFEIEISPYFVFEKCDKEYEIKNFMKDKFHRMEKKYINRMENGKKQIERFRDSKKYKTLVQVRNTFELKELIQYAENLKLKACKFESEKQTDKKLEKIEIRLPDKDSDHCPSECGCARYSVKTESKKVPTLYVLIKKS